MGEETARKGFKESRCFFFQKCLPITQNTIVGNIDDRVEALPSALTDVTMPTLSDPALRETPLPTLEQTPKMQLLYVQSGSPTDLTDVVVGESDYSMQDNENIGFGQLSACTRLGWPLEQTPKMQPKECAVHTLCTEEKQERGIQKLAEICNPSSS